MSSSLRDSHVDILPPDDFDKSDGPSKEAIEYQMKRSGGSKVIKNLRKRKIGRPTLEVPLGTIYNECKTLQNEDRPKVLEYIRALKALRESDEKAVEGISSSDDDHPSGE